MIKTVTAIERDGLNLRLLTMVFEVPSRSDFDLMDALRKAVNDFCRTEEGRKVYEYNCGYFNLADIDMSLPKEWLEKYEIEYIDTCPSYEIDWDESFCTEGFDGQ